MAVVVLISIVVAVVVISVVVVAVIVFVVLEVVLVFVLLVVVVVIGALMGARAVIDTFLEGLTVGMRVEVLISLSEMTVDLLMDATNDTILCVASNVGVEVLVDINANAFTDDMTAFEFDMPGPFEAFRCVAAFDCRPIAALDCDSVLQVRMPSNHVWSCLALPARPHFPNQAPLRLQQLIFPDFAMMPHLGHTELMVVVVAAAWCVYVRISQQYKHEDSHHLV